MSEVDKWLDKACDYENKGNHTMAEKCLKMALKKEEENELA